MFFLDDGRTFTRLTLFDDRRMAIPIVVAMIGTNGYSCAHWTNADMRIIRCLRASSANHRRRCGFGILSAGTSPGFGRSVPIWIQYLRNAVRVLVVEDDPLIREIVVEALQDAGFDVIEASNGEEALDWCGKRIADVLVTDIRLPGQIDGWQIAERCREHDPLLPVIYATGFSPVEARPVSGSLTLSKPYLPERVVQAVRKMGRDRAAAS
jgi:CheY-like chemotaxis protein